MKVPLKYPNMKRIIIISSNSDFVPAIESLKEFSVKTILYTYYEKKRPFDADFNDLHDLLDGINNLSGTTKRNFIFDNIDIPRMLNYWAAMVLMHDNDAVHKNFFMYRDTAGTQRWYMLPWDKDLTWGRNYNEGGVLNDDIWADVDYYYYASWGASAPSHPLYGNEAHKKVDGLWNRLIEDR